MPAVKDEVVSSIRACIISCPNKISTQELHADYHELVGERIPFQRLGFSTLEDLLLSIPGIELSYTDGVCFVIASPTNSSCHILDLVQKQKNNRKPKPSYPTRRYSTVSYGGRGRRGFKRGAAANRVPQNNPRKYNDHQTLGHIEQDMEIRGGSHSAPSSSKSPRAQFRRVYRNPFPATSTSHSLSPGKLASREPFHRILARELGGTSRHHQSTPPAITSKRFDREKLITSSHPTGNTAENECTYKPGQFSTNTSHSLSYDELAISSSNCSDITQTTSKCESGLSEAEDPVTIGYNFNNRQRRQLSHSIQTPKRLSPANLGEADVDAQGRMDRMGIGRSKSPHATHAMRPEQTITDKDNSNESSFCHNQLKTADLVGGSENCMVASEYPEPDDVPESTNVDIIEQRILDMVKDKIHGVWLFEIEKAYAERFSNFLPKNFPQLIRNSKAVEIEKLTSTLSVVRPRNLHAVGNRIEMVALPPEDTFDVLVSWIKNAHEVYVRLREYSSKYEQLTSEMDLFYIHEAGQSQYCLNQRDLHVNRYYAYVSDSSHRVLLLRKTEDSCGVYFVDVGAFESVALRSLRVLHPSFYILPAQAVTCYLEDLENFTFSLSEEGVRSAINRLMMSKTFSATLSSRNPLRVTLTSKDGEIMNDAIRHVFWKSFAPINLMDMASLMLVDITSIDARGRVFVRVHSWALKCLNQILSSVSEGTYQALSLEKPCSPSPRHYYLHKKYSNRVSILKCSDNIAEICLVDTGEVIDVPIDDVCDVPELDDVLQYIPPQAVHVLLDDVQDGRLTSQQTEIVHLMNSNNPPVLAKVIGYRGAPVVELFVRNENNLLMSINKNINICPNLFESGSFTAERACKAFNIRLNDEIAFYVSRVKTPFNITVIPLELLKQGKSLAEMMMKYYYSTSGVDDSLLHPGEFAAVFYDQHWCRARIIEKIDSDCFKVILLDVGCVIFAPKKAIRILDEEFKKLPFMAFRAQLCGVRPITSEWEECACCRLRDLILSKTVYALVKNITFCSIGERCLSLEIVDTSTDEDLFISRQLVLEKLAMPSECDSVTTKQVGFTRDC